MDLLKTKVLEHSTAVEKVLHNLLRDDNVEEVKLLELRERKGEGPTRFVCWMRATELKIVSETERDRERESRSPGEGEVAFYASKTDINHVSI